MRSRRLYYISRFTQLFLETDATNLKVDEIAASVGITKKTLYNHFESKQQLIECVVDEYLKNKEDELRKIVRENANPIMILLHSGKIFETAQHSCSQLIISKNERSILQPMPQIVLKHRNNFIDLIRFTFRKGINNGLFEDNLDTATTSRMYISMMESTFCMQPYLQRPPANKQQQNKMLYYLIKGCCTAKGLDMLRETIDIKVEAL
jgi:AcrR family transcriptional regulator